MSKAIEVKVVIDASLVEYFEQGRREDHLEANVGELLTEFLASLLGDTNYPMTARREGEREIHLNYRAKAFADPIF
ncbi:MAG: hypothetical protein C0624_01320 [Desulfuromonas sp.]|nr:MAG: hypothetical protein C0624_01320 [Desulfuromonas sp.]